MTSTETDDRMTEDDDMLDVMLDRLDAGLPPASPEEAAARAPYERLLARVRALPQAAPTPGWEERAAQRWRFVHGARRRRWLAVTAGAFALAAAVGLFLTVRPRGRQGRPDASAYVTLADGTKRAGVAPVGSTLHARAPRVARHVELRVYGPENLITRCPGATTCREDDGELALDVRLGAPGLYRPVVLSSDRPIAAPGGADIDADLLIARDAGATILVLATTRVAR